jgi:outer membrane murein-binding lipoprotein Lpp
MKRNSTQILAGGCTGPGTRMRAAEVMEVSRMEDLFDRVDRLENEMAALMKRKAAAGADRQT